MGGCLGFSSFAEFNTYITFLFLGMSIMMVVSTITSAPSFVVEYYRFATGKPNAPCEKAFFWDNANTFYNVGTYVAQIIFEPLSLTEFMRKLPLQPRLILAVSIPLAELFILVIVPVGKISTQDGAIAVLMVVAVFGGFSKALCDSTANALVGPFPTKFMNGEQWGLAVIALFMSILQCILKGAMSDSFHDVLTQSRIYLSIGMALQAFALFEVMIMHKNPFAQKYVAEFRVKKTKVAHGEGASENGPDVNWAEHAGGDDDSGEMNAVSGESLTREETERRAAVDKPASGRVHVDPEADIVALEEKLEPIGDADDELRVVGTADDYNANELGGNGAPGVSVLNAKGDADKMVDADQTGNLTSSDQMMRTNACSVIARVWPMLVCAFIIFFNTMFIFPGVFFLSKLTGTKSWYTTLVVLLFNIGDFLSRILLMFPLLRPPPKLVILGTVVRLIIIPLLVLCIRGIINGMPLPLILALFLGLTNGFFGSMSLIHCPRTPSLHTAGERSIAAIWAGIFLMCGLCAGSNLALTITLTWPKGGYK